MRIADWPIERIRSLWVGAMVYLAALIVLGVTLNGTPHAAGGPRARQEERPLTPAEQARGDSLMDSLRVVFHNYAHSAEGQSTAVMLGQAIKEVGATGRKIMLIVLTIALSPLLIVAGITIAWYRARSVPRSAGA